MLQSCWFFIDFHCILYKPATTSGNEFQRFIMGISCGKRFGCYVWDPCNTFDNDLRCSQRHHGKRIVSTYRWLSAGLQYLQCVSKRDTAVLYKAFATALLARQSYGVIIDPFRGLTSRCHWGHWDIRTCHVILRLVLHHYMTRLTTDFVGHFSYQTF